MSQARVDKTLDKLRRGGLPAPTSHSPAVGPATTTSVWVAVKALELPRRSTSSISAGPRCYASTMFATTPGQPSSGSRAYPPKR
jgi:hypothetical protein